jgi:WD40 repeat protein
VSHSDMPILSVDAQPNGYRFVTGGQDHKVCVWNLLPVISEQYEKMGAKKKNAQEERKSNNEKVDARMKDVSANKSDNAEDDEESVRL